MQFIYNGIMVGNWVKILKESQTKGLVGAVLKVVALKPDNVVVSALDTEVLFKYDEVKVLTFKERWGFDRMPRLYHGTDLRFVKIPEEVRQKYLAFCKSLINDFIKIYEPYITDKESISEQIAILNKSNIAFDFNSAISVLHLMNCSEEFEYGDFYLTRDKYEACQYAHNAFVGGELANTTYFLYKALPYIGMKDLYNKLNNMPFIQLMNKLADEDHQPAIFFFDNLSPEYLRTEMNESITRYVKNGRLRCTTFRYSQALSLNNDNYELINLDLDKALKNIEEEDE